MYVLAMCSAGRQDNLRLQGRLPLSEMGVGGKIAISCPDLDFLGGIPASRDKMKYDQ